MYLHPIEFPRSQKESILFHHSTKIHALAILWGVLILGLSLAPSAQADHHEGEAEKAPTVEEQILGLEEMCAANAEAVAERNSEKSLYERLGGEEKIREIVVEIVRLHDENEDFERFMPKVDQEHLVDAVTQFLVAGTGGPGDYEGKNMVDAHTHLKLTNADFLSAGSDVMQAMKNKGCGEDETQEVICTLVSLRAAVVIESDKVLQ
jgi:hemoglobin